MQFINSINYGSLADTAISLCAAFVLGGLIGLERQYRQRTAGLRTNILVAVGAAIFVDAANRLTGNDGAVHVMAYVVSGIDFWAPASSCGKRVMCAASIQLQRFGPLVL